MPRYLSRGDYLFAISKRKEAKEQRKREWRKDPHVWTDRTRPPLWLVEIFAIHPDNENAPWLPMFWRYNRTGNWWYCCVPDSDADQVERQARIIFGIQSDMEERNG